MCTVYPPFSNVANKRHTTDTVEEHSAERQQSRRKLIKCAKARIEEDYENQKVCDSPATLTPMSPTVLKIATDASALIKHYKALLLS